MRCKHVTRRLDAYVTGEVSARDRVQIEAHLEGCPNCRKALARLKGMADLLGQIQVPPVPEGFAGRVMALAQERVAKPKGVLVSPWDLVAWWQTISLPVRVAAGVVLVLGLGMGILMGLGTWQEAPDVTAGQGAQSDPLAAYNLDYLTDAPNGSLAESFLTLTSTGNQQGS